MVTSDGSLLLAFFVLSTYLRIMQTTSLSTFSQAVMNTNAQRSTRYQAPVLTTIGSLATLTQGGDPGITDSFVGNGPGSEPVNGTS